MHTEYSTDKFYRSLANTFASCGDCLKKEKTILKIKKIYSLIFNIVGLDVSESQLEQGSLILEFYFYFSSA
jgi:hypothetical protein